MCTSDQALIAIEKREALIEILLGIDNPALSKDFNEAVIIIEKNR